MSPQKNQSGEIVRSVWKQLFVKYGLCNSQWGEILSGEGLIFRGPIPKLKTDAEKKYSKNSNE